MAEPVIVYDEPADTLYIAFYPGESATGLKLSDHILLRVDKRNQRAIGITLLDFAILTSESETGPRSFPLKGLDELTPESRKLALELLHLPPVRDYLILVESTTAGASVIPSAMLNMDKLVARAA